MGEDEEGSQEGGGAVGESGGCKIVAGRKGGKGSERKR